MAVRVYKPRNSSLRNRSVSRFDTVTKHSPEKSLTKGKKRISARNNKGRVTVRWRGGGHKRRYRMIDFKRNKLEVSGRVQSIEYDPNRTCRIALIYYEDGSKAYILSPEGLKAQDKVISSDKGADVKVGNSLPLSQVPTGISIHNIEVRPGRGGQLVRSAGVEAIVVGKSQKYAQVRMPSGEVRQILSTCRASIGVLGNADHENIQWGKAGRTRYKGRRPKVRGMVMNPIDHPLGGGEGVSKGNHPMTPWGKSCKGKKTRSNKRTDKMIVTRRKRKRK